MKLHVKKIALSISILLIYVSAFCQHMTEAEFYKNKVLDGGVWVDTTKATPTQMARIHKGDKAKILAKDHYYFDYPWKNIGVRFTPGSSSKKSEIYEGNPWGINNQHKSIIIDGVGGVEFSALDVTEANAADFRYHIVQNDKKELVQWTKPTVFRKTADGKAVYAYLGKFDCLPGQVLMVEIYNIHDYANLDAAIIDWRKAVAPDVDGVVEYFSTHWPLVDNALFGKGLKDKKQTTEIYPKRVGKKIQISTRETSVKDFIETTDLTDIRFRADDSVKNLSFWIRNGKATYNSKITLSKPDGDIIQLGETNDKIKLIKDIWKTPGKYTITFTPKLKKHGGRPVILLHNLANSITFTVLPAENESIPRKTVYYIVLIILTTGAFIFVMYRSGQKRKLAGEAQKKQIATLQLQSVRAQLNPHFIFNALAGIQNLMNKNAIEDANKYLARFARLTRNVLDDGQKDLISIEKETDLLDDYLKMEQTRFGFNFSIEVDSRLDQQIEIPAMLLQPFVENAVKHGISALKEKGQVNVRITQAGTDVLLYVQDNGKGFISQQTNGQGIKLCRERIALLNSIHKNTTILLNINPAANGTNVIIELKNWL